MLHRLRWHGSHYCNYSGTDCVWGNWLRMNLSSGVHHQILNHFRLKKKCIVHSGIDGCLAPKSWRGLVHGIQEININPNALVMLMPLALRLNCGSKFVQPNRLNLCRLQAYFLKLVSWPWLLYLCFCALNNFSGDGKVEHVVMQCLTIKPDGPPIP